MIDLAELETKARAATQGQWSVEPHGSTRALYAGRNNERHGLRLLNLDDGDRNIAANAAYIAAAQPSVVLELIERVREVEAQTAEPVAWETCPNCNGSGLQLNSAGEPDDCRECKGDTVVCALQERVRVLEEALRPFVIGSAEREHLLWGHLPDDAPGTTTTKLGDYRRARKALGGSNE